jgi:glycosyltransferase involved in cell wall biosynthesis
VFHIIRKSKSVATVSIQESEPLVTIIIPLWNRKHLIGETLESCFAQTYKHLDIIVVDDGSSDGSQSTVTKCQHRDQRVKLIRRDSLPKGAPACRNLGLQHAKGQFVIFLDSDDLLASTAVENRVSQIIDHHDCDLVVAQGLIFKEFPGDMNLLWNRCAYGTDELIVRFLDQDIPWQTSGPLWRRSSLPESNAWNPDLCSFQDWEFHLRMLLGGARAVILDRPDYYIRRSEEERISQKHFEQSHVEARVNAISSVWQLIESNQGIHKDWATSVRAFVIRNQLQLIDAGREDLCPLFTQSTVGSQLLTVGDRLMLNWIRRIGPRWHWHSRVRKFTSLIWSKLTYDSFKPTDFLASSWELDLPKVSINHTPP